MSGREYKKIFDKYVRDVLKGKVEVCEYVKLACERHKRDLKNKKYRFNKKKLEDVCRFIERLPHVKGEWARRRELITLEPWQIFIVGSIFGWIDRETKLRRYTRTYIEVPRKNAKSTLAAAIGLYMLTKDNEAGAEVYAGATTEDQAFEVFRPMRQMALNARGFISHFGVDVGKKNLSIEKTGSFARPIIGKPGDGASPSCAITDEYHQHPTSESYDTMRTGMGARSQPLHFTITTAGVNIAGPCYEMRNQEAVKVLKQEIEDESLFVLIYTLDDNDDWKDFSTWKKANPNYGVSVREKFLREQYQTALQVASKQNIILTKHCNVWRGASVGWLNMATWDENETDKTLEDMDGLNCYLGVDIANKTDIAAVCLLFVDGDKYYCFGKYFLPEETVEQPSNQHYRNWQYLKNLIVTDGAVTHYAEIEQAVKDLLDDMRVEEVAYDPWNASQLAERLTEDGATCVEVRQGAKTLSEPMKRVEELVLSHRLLHPADPIMKWQIANVVAKYDDNDNVRPTKEFKQNKIDFAVALIMAMSRAMFAEEGCYSEEGFLTL